MVDHLNSLLDPRYMKVFVAVAETKSMSVVGKQLGISQSGVSQTIRNIEEQLKTDLFSRERRPLVLTRQGEILYGHALKILEMHNSAIQAVRNVSGHQLSKLHIAMANSCAETIAPKLVCEFGDLASQWQISSGITPDHVNLFLERGVDMIVTVDEMLEGYQNIDRFELVKEPYVLAVPADYNKPIDFEILMSDLPFIRYGLNSSTGRRIEQQLSRLNVLPPRWIEIESVIGQMEIIGAGRGFGLTTPLCYASISNPENNIRLAPLKKGGFTRQINLIARKKEDHAIAIKIAKSCQKILKNQCFKKLVREYDWLEEKMEFF